MSEHNKATDKSNDDGGDDNDAVQETWEPGLRRRRRRPDQNGNGNNGNDGTAAHHRHNNVSSSAPSLPPMTPVPPPNNHASGGNLSTGLPCGIGNAGGGGVGILTSPAPGPATTSGTPFGGGGFGTPYKTPTKDGNNNNSSGLVAITPSSVTTAGETVESTVISQSSSPLRIRRQRTRSTRRGRTNVITPTTAASPSLRRQYQLLQSQIYLLLTTSTLGLILFLFYALPLAAFISFTLMISSLGALFPVIRSTVRARYEMELANHPLGLLRYLPESLRIMLTETTLHDFMTDTTFMMEHRYLLLYFMPGLSPEQLGGYIDRLPPRHREALLQPGLGRLMPSVMENFMRLDNNSHDNTDNTGGSNALLLENGGDDASVASGLTTDHHHGEDGEENENEDNGQVEVNEGEVTLLDAIISLRGTLAGLASSAGSSNSAGAGDIVASAPTIATATPAAAPPVAVQTSIPENVQNNTAVIQDDDNSSMDFSFDLSATGLPLHDDDNDGENVNNEVPATIVEMPPVALPGSNQQQTDDAQNDQDEAQQQQQQQQDWDLEGRILSEAASTAVSNFSSQAAAAARETASEAMASSSSWIVQAGTVTGLVAGGAGGIMAAMLSNQQQTSFVVTLGSLVGSIRNSNAATGGSSNNGNNANDATPSGSSSSSSFSGQQQHWIQGLLATSAIGFASAGLAYLVRNRVRANIAANREKMLLSKDENNQDDRDWGGDDDK